MIFVHIPKTGGIALTNALMAAFPESTLLPARHWKGHRRLRDEIGKYQDYDSFTILRHPFDIYRSFHAWHRSIDDFSYFAEGAEPIVRKLASQTLDACVQQWCACDSLENGNGFLDTYCLPYTKVVLFGDAHRGVDELLDVKLDLKRENVSKVPKDELSDASKQLIANRCMKDMKTIAELMNG